MRVAHVIPGLAKAAGPSAFCVRASEFLAQAGVEVDLHVGVLAKDSLLPQDQRVAVSEFGKTFQPARRPDVIHVHALWMMASHRAMAFARRNKIPYVVSAHGMLAPWALRHKWLKKRIAWWLYQKRDLAGAAMFHATAECEIKWLRDLGFRQPCVVAPLGSDLPDLNNAEAQRRQDVKTVLFVGRIYPVKGLMNLVKAWARVRSSKVLKCESAKVGETEDGERSSKVLKCESALVRKTADGGGSSKVLKCESAKIADGNQLDRSGSENFRTLELQNFRTFPWQLVIAGPDQAGHKAELVAEAERLGLTVADATVSDLIRVSHADTDRQPLERDNSRVSSSEFPVSRLSPHALPSDLLFTGPVYGEEKDTLYRLADLFVLPSFTENFGVVVTDALAFGVPVITTKGAPWQELLGSSASSSFATSGRSGWWVDIGVEPLAEALCEAMRLTDAERCQMGMNGRRLVETKYTWPAVAAELKRAYERVLDPGDESARMKKR